MSENTDLDPPVDQLMDQLIGQARAIAWKHWHGAPYVLEYDELVSLAHRGLVEAKARWPQYCLTPETPVLTAALFWVPVGEVSVGQELIGVDEYPGARSGGRCYRRAFVSEVSRRLAQCLELLMDDGRSVICTADHRWLLGRQIGQYRARRLGMPATSNYSWWQAGSITPGTVIASPLRPWRAEDSYEAGWLAGIYDGEGSVNHKSAVSVAQNPGPVLDRMKQLLAGMDVPFTARERSAGPCTKLEIATRRHALELLGRLRPIRLMPKADSMWEGRRIYNRGLGFESRVLEIRSAGVREVVTIETSTGTFLANGLVSHNCADRGFDPATTRYFSEYCRRRMNGAILDYKRSQDWLTRVDRNRVRSLREAGQDLGRSEAEMAASTGMTREQVSQTLAAVARRPVGFDPIEHDVTDAADTESHAVVDDLLAEAVRVLAGLPIADQHVMCLTFYYGLSIKQAAEALGLPAGEVTAMQQQGALAVHQALARAARNRED